MIVKWKSHVRVKILFVFLITKQTSLNVFVNLDILENFVNLVSINYLKEADLEIYDHSQWKA